MHGRAITLPPLINFFYHLCYNVIHLTSIKITQPLRLLLSFLHNRIPCMHNVWAADNLKPLEICFFYPLYRMEGKFGATKIWPN